MPTLFYGIDNSPDGEKTETFVHFHGATMKIIATANKLKQKRKTI